MTLFSNFLRCLKTGISSNHGRVPVSICYVLIIIMRYFQSYCIS
jgi:hypothetical protein